MQWRRRRSAECIQSGPGLVHYAGNCLWIPWETSGIGLAVDRIQGAPRSVGWRRIAQAWLSELSMKVIRVEARTLPAANKFPPDHERQGKHQHGVNQQGYLRRHR